MDRITIGLRGDRGGVLMVLIDDASNQTYARFGQIHVNAAYTPADGVVLTNPVKSPEIDIITI
jgi:hypothetical protein